MIVYASFKERRHSWRVLRIARAMLRMPSAKPSQSKVCLPRARTRVHSTIASLTFTPDIKVVSISIILLINQFGGNKIKKYGSNNNLLSCFKLQIGSKLTTSDYHLIEPSKFAGYFQECFGFYDVFCNRLWTVSGKSLKLINFLVVVQPIWRQMRTKISRTTIWNLIP